MTREELKQLKKGDEVFVKAVFDWLAKDGDAYVLFFWTNCRGERITGNVAVTIDSVLLRSDLQQPAEKPKYDPCRRFKKWDRVRPVVRYGRTPDDGALANVTYVVVDDEKNGLVSIARHDGKSGYAHTVTALYLELVTPVEELEPYSVKPVYETIKEEDGLLGYEVVNAEGLPEIIFFGGKGKYRVMQEAKEAAEAECARLNAEYRKEQA